MVIIAILVTWLHGHRRQRHQRWLEYRRLAECLRHMRILAPIGSEGSVDRPRRSLSVEEEQDWVNWYAWSLRRLLPLPDCAVDHGYLVAMRDAVRVGGIAGQIEYHTANAARSAKLDHRIHRSGEMLFGNHGRSLCSIRLPRVVRVLREHRGPRQGFILGVFTFLTALLADAGGRARRDPRARRLQDGGSSSPARTAKRLAAIDKMLADEPPIFARLADRIEKTSDVMMADLLEWHTVFRTRPLSLPA